MPINSREKGVRAERELNNMLKAAFPQYAEALKRNKDQDSIGGDDITGLPGYSIECKFVADKQWSLSAFWAQTCRQCKDAVPLVMRKISQKGWWIYISLADFDPDQYGDLDRCDTTYVIVLSYDAWLEFARRQYAATNPQ